MAKRAQLRSQKNVILNRPQACVMKQRLAFSSFEAPAANSFESIPEDFIGATQLINRKV